MPHSPFAHAATTRYLARPDGRIAYDLAGTGPLVVLVPGMAELRSSYRHLAPALVAAGYTVATTELRGHGDSDATFTRYGDEATATDIVALIDELGAPAVVVGNSLAAGAGVIAAAEHPEPVLGLVLVGPFVRNPPVSPLLQWLMRVMTAPAWAATVWRSYMPTLYSGAKPADFAQYRRAVTESLRRRAYARAFSQTVRGADHAPAEARLERVTAPSLVVMGTLDPDFPDPAAEARWIAERLAASVVMVDDAGHYPHAQQPEQTAAAILEFLATVTADA